MNSILYSILLNYHLMEVEDDSLKSTRFKDGYNQSIDLNNFILQNVLVEDHLAKYIEPKIKYLVRFMQQKY